MAAADAEAGASPYYLVQFTGPVEAYWLDQVAAPGGAVVGYVPNDTHIVRMTPAPLAAVPSPPPVRWVGPFRPAYQVATDPAPAATSVGAFAPAPPDLTVPALPGGRPSKGACGFLGRHETGPRPVLGRTGGGWGGGPKRPPPPPAL